MSDTQTGDDDSKQPQGGGGFSPAPKEDWTLLFQGAEAKVWKVPMMMMSSSSSGSTFVVCKERFSKAYRHPELDERLTKSRCRSEARMLEKCGKSSSSSSSLRVPSVVRVEAPILYMEYIQGPSLKEYLRTFFEKQQEGGETMDLFIHTLAVELGKLIAAIHNLGVIHGDLTTSNMLILEDGSSTYTLTQQQQKQTFELVLIDFGLAKSSSSAEEQAVDLYVLERALLSTHPDLPDHFLDDVLKSYAEHATSAVKNPKKSQQSTLSRLEQVRLRGRKRECFG